MRVQKKINKQNNRIWDYRPHKTGHYRTQMGRPLSSFRSLSQQNFGFGLGKRIVAER